MQLFPSLNLKEKQYILYYRGNQFSGEPMKGIPWQRFYVELNPNDTTILSWKKLLRYAHKEREPFSVGEVCDLPEK